MLVVTFHNDGTGDQEIGNYNVKVMLTKSPTELVAIHQCRIERFSRRLPWWKLVELLLRKQKGMRDFAVSTQDEDRLAMNIPTSDGVQMEAPKNAIIIKIPINPTYPVRIDIDGEFKEVSDTLEILKYMRLGIDTRLAVLNKRTEDARIAFDPEK